MKSSYMKFSDDDEPGGTSNGTSTGSSNNNVMERNIVERNVLERPIRPPQAPGQYLHQHQFPQATLRKKSLFAQNRQQEQQSQNGINTTGNMASPSTNVPLGVFVKKKKNRQKLHKQQHDPQPQKSSNAASTSATQYLSQSTPQQVPVSQAAAQDAEAMFERMSPAERLENAKELQAALSPQAIAYFKNRNKIQKQKNTNTNKKDNNNKGKPMAIHAGVTIDQQKTERTNNNNNLEEPKQSTTSTSNTRTSTTNDTEEKQRIAQLLSNVKTVDDLDAAYKAEVGDFSPLASELGNDIQQKEPFQIACMLLRSTVPRQNLWAAKIVSQHFQQQWELGRLCSVVPEQQTQTQETPPWPYPVLMPAALRCLLDAPATQTGVIIHTFVLNAIYNLLRLRSCAEHVVDINDMVQNDNVHATAIHQLCFLEDAIPTPPVGSTYPSTDSVQAIASDIASSTATPAAYKTSSSSKSAKTDGEAFGKDPSWTLLSKMCILPRLAQLVLKSSSSSSPQQQQSLPNEALTAICGILAIIGQRSPGTATAIVFHPTLLRDLLDHALKPQHREDHKDDIGTAQNPYDVALALPAIRLLGTLARQSRVVAERILAVFDEYVPPILAIKPKTKPEHTLQVWSLILWRTLLRYGLGVPQIPTMIALSVRHMVATTAGAEREGRKAMPFSLATEFSTCFAHVLFCSQTARTQLSEQNQNSNDGEITKEDVDESVLAANRWLSSTAKQAVASLETCSFVNDKEAISAQQLQFWAAQLQFMSAYLDTSAEDSIPVLDSTIRDKWISICQSALVAFMRQDVLKTTLNALCAAVFACSFSELPDPIDGLVYEASACAFLCSFVSLQFCLVKLILGQSKSTLDAGDADSGATLESSKLVFAEFASILETTLAMPLLASSRSRVVTGPPCPRRGWLNRTCFASIQMLEAAKSYFSLSTGHSEVTRTLQFSLLGRLERGDEAMAAVLLSQDSSFDVREVQTSAKREGKFSLISSVFLKELCVESSARLQLEHSFNLLRHGPGVSRDEFGISKLRLLLSDVDSIVPSRNHDFLLPIGTLWLWMTLSSSVSSAPSNDGTIHEEDTASEQSYGTEVLSSSLRLISELEQSSTPGDQINPFNYAAQIDNGAKAYHLLLLCFHPEHILQSDEVAGPAEFLLELYTRDMDNSFAVAFARACLLHSSGKKKKFQDDSSEATGTSSKAEKIVSELLHGREADRRGLLSEDETRAVLGFLNELCDVFLQYGAQYDFCVRCVRCFLMPTFPSRIRCKAASRLGDVLSVISLPGEEDPWSDAGRLMLVPLLERSIPGSSPEDGGLTTEDGGLTRESPQFLDALVAVYGKGGNPRVQVGYTLILFVLVHARHLAMCLQPGWVGLEAELKRLQKVNDEVASMVTNAARKISRCTANSKSDMVEAAIDAVQRKDA
ncbi:expressed unknown protein [Seminavis robusta]|uniref:Uncharacterized protein n=1 Tax=Seminavis robusta TaxID=568900 RepID=A0A9N8DRR0_9STRA|nr:expressed unknown protein [Seminavis robusta]|eukprot:Sro305_g112830.1 n/a (1417) ;mRNA; f:58940-63190